MKPESEANKSEAATPVSSGTLVMPHCPDCEKGDKPRLLDNDGVLCEISGQPGRWSHAYDIYWWDCPIKQPDAKVRLTSNIRTPVTIMNHPNLDRFQLPTAREDLHICAECGVEITGDVVWVHDVPYHWNCQPNNQDEDDE